MDAGAIDGLLAPSLLTPNAEKVIWHTEQLGLGEVIVPRHVIAPH